MDVIYATRVALESDVAPPAGAVGFVYADPANSNNDFYIKVGSSGTGSWTLTPSLHTAVKTIAAVIADAALNTFYGGAGNTGLTGGSNTGLGVSAAQFVTSGSNNTDLGRAAGRANLSGSENVNVGSSAGIFVPGGDKNTRLGAATQGSGTTATSRVTAVGYHALAHCGIDLATAVGSEAGAALSTGTDFTAIGANAGAIHSNENAITMVGSGAGVNPGQTLAQNNQTAIGAGSYCNWTNQVTLGNDSVSELRLFGHSWARRFAYADTVIGEDAGNRSPNGGGRVIIGYQAGVGMATTDDESAVVIGYAAGNQAQKFRYSVAIGDRVAQFAYNCIDCSLIGSQAGRNLGLLEPAAYESDDEAHIKAAGSDVTHGGSLPVPALVGATFMGKNAGRYNTIGTNNTGFGDSALGFTTVGLSNTAIGYVCGEGNVIGSRNSWVGQGVRLRLYSGDDNAQVGYGIGSNLGAHGDWRAGGSRNSNLGAAAVYVWGGDDTASLGFNTFFNMTGGAGGDVGIGSRAGEAIITGGRNIFIGQNAGRGAVQATDVQNSIAIGADVSTTKSNQTIIGNAATQETAIRGTVVRFDAVTVAELPSAIEVGMGARAFVSDADGPTFNATPVGGGSAAVPVFSTGTEWRVG